MALGQLPLRKIAHSPNSNPNLNPKPNCLDSVQNIA